MKRCWAPLTRFSTTGRRSALLGLLMHHLRPSDLCRMKTISTVPAGELTHRMEVAACGPIDLRAAESSHSCRIDRVWPVHRFQFWIWHIYDKVEPLRKLSA